MTSTPISEKLFTIRSTSRSLPGMVLDEKRNRSPAFISIPRYLPRDSCALAARRSPCDPVTISIRLPRGTSAASSGLTVRGKSVRTPDCSAAATMRFIARPIRQTERSAARAASAKVLQAGDVGGKGGRHDQPTAPSDKVTDRFADGAFGSAWMQGENVGGIAHQRLHRALGRDFGKTRVIPCLAHDRVGIQLEVAGMDDAAGGCVDHQRGAFGDGMADGDELHLEGADFHRFGARGDHVDRLDRQALLFELQPSDGGGEAAGIDGLLQARPEMPSAPM
jgi:hypothetical protein